MTRTVIDVAKVIDEQRMGSLHWKVVILSFVIMLTDGYDTVCVAYVAPLLRQEWNFSPAAFGPLFASGLLGAALGPVLVGHLADRVGRKPIILTGTLWFGVLTLAAVFAQSLNQLMILRFLAGLGIGGVLAIGTALVAEFAPRRIRATMIVMGVVGVALGGGLGGLMAALVLGHTSWHIVFWIGGLIPIALAVIGYFVFPESAKFLTLKPERWDELTKLLKILSPSLHVPADAKFVLGDEANAPKFSFKALFLGRLAAITPLLWVSNFLALLQLYFVNQWTPLLLTGQGTSVPRAALATAAFQICGFLGALAITRPVDRWGFAPVPALFAVGALVVGLIGMPGGSEMWVIALSGLSGFCVIGIQFANIASQSQVYPTYIRSWGVGVCYTFGRCGSVVGPLFAGVLVGFNVSINTLFYISGTLMGFGFVVALVLVPLYRKQLSEMQTAQAI
ncbi:MFS transporter [Rhodoplanes roseus]|nr:MFS transporter [Rhodoplanes roseus]